MDRVATGLPLPARSRTAPGATVTVMVAGASALAGVRSTVYAPFLPRRSVADPFVTMMSGSVRPVTGSLERMRAVNGEPPALAGPIVTSGAVLSSVNV